jgi:sulfur carrier protein
MQVTINGKKEEVNGISTITDLLNQKNIEPRMVSVELNSALLDRAHLSTTALHEGDQIEFLYFMGGGAPRATANGPATLWPVGHPISSIKIEADFLLKTSDVFWRRASGIK